MTTLANDRDAGEHPALPPGRTGEEAERGSGIERQHEAEHRQDRQHLAGRKPASTTCLVTKSSTTTASDSHSHRCHAGIDLPPPARHPGHSPRRAPA